MRALQPHQYSKAWNLNKVKMLRASYALIARDDW